MSADETRPIRIPRQMLDPDDLRKQFVAATEPHRERFPWRVVARPALVIAAIVLLVWIAGQGEPQPVTVPPPPAQPTVTVTVTADTTIDVHGS